MRRAKLAIRWHGNEREFFLTKQNTTIGRGKGRPVDVLIDDPLISRLHARIFIQGDKYFLEDLSTFRRTSLNSVGLDQPVELKHQDLLKFANVEARFLLEEIPTEESSVTEESDPQQFVVESKKQAGSRREQQVVTKAFERVSLREEESVPLAPIEEEDSWAEEAALATGESINLPIAELPFAAAQTGIIVLELEDSENDLSRLQTNVAQLFCISSWKRVALEKEAVYIGKGEQNDLVISSDYAAKVQFAIIYNSKAKRYYLKHLGDNETRVNGKPIDSMEVLPDVATITTGEHIFYFLSGEEKSSLLADALNKALEGSQIGSNTSCYQEWEKGEAFFEEKIVCQFQIIGQQEPLSCPFFFTKETKQGIYVFWGEMNLSAREASSAQQQVAKTRGVFETAVDYSNSLVKIMGTIHREVFFRKESTWILGNLLCFTPEKIKWIGGSNAPLVLLRKDGVREILSSPSTPLGLHELFFGQEQECNWEEGEQLLLFSRNLLLSSLKSSPELLINLESIERLFSYIAKGKKTNSLAEFIHTLKERTQLPSQCVVSVISHEG